MDMRTLRCWMNMDKSRSMDSKTSENQSYQNMFHSNIYQWDHLRCHATGAPAQMVRKATRVERTSAKGGIWSRRWPSKRHTPGEHRWKAGWKAGISCSSSQRWSLIGVGDRDQTSSGDRHEESAVWFFWFGEFLGQKKVCLKIGCSYSKFILILLN